MQTQQKTIRFDLHRLIEPIKNCDVINDAFDIFVYKTKKLAKYYDISAYKKYQKEVKELDIVNAKNILHVGCGSYPATAIALANLLDAKIVALDKDPKVIEYAKSVIRKKKSRAPWRLLSAVGRRRRIWCAPGILFRQFTQPLFFLLLLLRHFSAALLILIIRFGHSAVSFPVLLFNLLSP